MTRKRTEKSGSEAQPTFEEALEQVEAIIERIESGEIGLERSIAEYERGVAMIRRCREVLAKAEQRVQDLTAQMLSDADPSPAADDRPEAEADEDDPEPPF